MINRVVIALALSITTAGAAHANDWPSWRGPEQTGLSRESAVVTSWSQDGENLLWKVPVGGRTTPIMIDGRLCMITPTGEGESLRERVICLDAESGRTVWEHSFNVFHTDIVENRLGWTSVAGDPQSGNIYAHGTGGELFCFDKNGKVRWKHSLGEEFGRYSGYGGRLHTPIIDEDRVVISYVYILSNWGTGKRKAGHRYLALDKHTGKVVWWSQPGGRPLDTTYSVPVVSVINGRRMLIAGNADGNIYGMLARTGEKVWTFRLGKRGINSSVVVDGNYVYATHSEENLDNTDMGRVVCIDATLTGDITETGEVWRFDGCKAGYSSPAIANGRLYVVTNSAKLYALDARTGESYWRYKLGRVMKGSPLVTADGVIYAGEVNGRFHILKDEGDKCTSLDVEKFERPDLISVELNGSPILADGRVYFMTSDNTYCLGKPGYHAEPVTVPTLAQEVEPRPTKPARLVVVPADVTVAPGERLQFEARVFDANGRLINTPSVEWSADSVLGTFESTSVFRASTKNEFQAGQVKATSGKLEGTARIRVSPRPPFVETFDQMPVGQPPPGWIGLDLKSKVVEKDGQRMLQKLALKPSAPYMRMRSFSGPSIAGGGVVEADILGMAKPTDPNVTPDMGLINTRYKLIMLGTEQKLRLVTYSPIPRIQKDIPFKWSPEVWYHAKLRVDLEGGHAIVKGNVWKRGESEPVEWQVRLDDPYPNTEGSPGLYGYSKGATDDQPGASIYYDNYQVRTHE